MRVLFVVHQFLPRFSTGTELYALRIATRLARRGLSVEILTFEPRFDRPGFQIEERDDEVEGLPVHRLTTGRDLPANPILAEYYHPWIAERFAAWLETRAPGVVHFFHQRFLGAGLLEEALRRGVPVVVQLMDFWYLCPKATLLKLDGTLCRGPRDVFECTWCLQDDPFTPYRDLWRFVEAHGLNRSELLPPSGADPRLLAQGSVPARLLAAHSRAVYLRELLQRAGRLVAPSRFLKDLFVSNGYREEAIRVIPYGVREDLGPHGRTEDRHLRFGYVGSLAPHKGVSLLLDAFSRLAWPEAELHLHADLSVFPDEARAIERATREDERIRIRGAFAEADAARVFAGLDVLVVPSVWYENTPFVALEARASGVPVVATDLGGLSEVVVEGQNGLLFRRRDPEALLAVLDRFRTEQGLLARLRRGCGGVPTLSENATAFEALYRE